MAPSGPEGLEFLEEHLTAGHSGGHGGHIQHPPPPPWGGPLDWGHNAAFGAGWGQGMVSIVAERKDGHGATRPRRLLPGFHSKNKGHAHKNSSERVWLSQGVGNIWRGGGGMLSHCLRALHASHSEVPVAKDLHERLTKSGECKKDSLYFEVTVRSVDGGFVLYLWFWFVFCCQA